MREIIFKIEATGCKINKAAQKCVYKNIVVHSWQLY